MSKHHTLYCSCGARLGSAIELDTGLCRSCLERGECDEGYAPVERIVGLREMEPGEGFEYERRRA